jgi:hypothetical protein
MKKATWVVCAMMLCAALARADVFTIGLNSTNLFTGTLNGLLESPPNASPATGGEVGSGISFNNSTGLLDINVAYGLFGFVALQGNYTAAHIHEGAVGVNGPVVIDLAPIQFSFNTHSGFFQGAVLLPLALQTALFNDALYMNIHSTLYPGGEIRAQLIPTTVPEPVTAAMIGLGLSALLVFRRNRS